MVVKVRQVVIAGMLNANFMQNVDFFLIGWPKTGSTSLHYYLSQHPEIFMSSMKESYYFCTDIIQDSDTNGRGKHFTCRSQDDYEKLFRGITAERMVGESSVFYCLSEEAIVNIKATYPDAKLLLILRDPVELVDSWFSYLKLHSRESAEDLETALGLQAEREANRSVPANTHASIHLRYDHLVDFPKHLNRIFSHFERESVCVILYDDLSQNETSVLASTYEFLGVDSNFTPDFTRKNVSRQPKNAGLKRIIDRRKTALARVLKRSGLLKPDSLFHRQYLKLFTTNQSRSRVAESQKLTLQDRYRQMVGQTSELLGQDLLEKWNY